MPLQSNTKFLRELQYFWKRKFWEWMQKFCIYAHNISYNIYSLAVGFLSRPILFKQPNSSLCKLNLNGGSKKNYPTMLPSTTVLTMLKFTIPEHEHDSLSMFSISLYLHYPLLGFWNTGIYPTSLWLDVSQHPTGVVDVQMWAVVC